MSDRPKWLQVFVEFFIDNVTVLATLGATAYVIFRQSISATKLSTDDLITAVLGVLGLLALSEIIERYRRLNSIEKTSKQALALLESKLADRSSALAFFTKLPPLDKYIQSANNIDMCGVTLTTAVNRQLSSIRERLSVGATVRVLVVDPTSNALKISDLRSEDPNVEYYRFKLEATFQDLVYLYQYQSRNCNTNKGKFEVRLLPYPPSFAIYSFDARRPTGQVIVEIYPHVTGWGNEPAFDLLPTRDGKWYEYFVDQFEFMWKSAKPFEVKAYTGQA